MEPVKIVPLRSNDPAVGVLPPQADKAHKVLDNGDCAEQRSANTEDGVCRQLVAGQAVPHAKVHANGHEDAVDEDERPEPDDGLFPCTKGVFERWRLAEVCILVRDLRVRVDRVRVRRCCAADVRAGSRGRHGCCATASLVVVARPVDVDARDLQRVRLAGAVCSRRPLWLCRRHWV